MIQTIYCENQSQNLTNLEFLRAVYALQYQVYYHFNRSPWFSTREGTVKSLPSGQKPPAGSWNLIFVDTKQEAGVLGYHEDVEGTEIPYSEVFVTEAKEYGESVSAVASHEMCLSGDTKIPLLNGTETTIKDMVGKSPQWVYSCDNVMRIKPGLAHSARITRKNAPTLIVTLDNGESITCTDNHKFMLRDSTFIEASQLKVGDSLMPLYRKHEVLEPQKDRKGKYDYEMVYQPLFEDWEWTHRVVLPNCPSNHVRHHKDFNRFNNSPDNFEILTWKYHAEVHSKQALLNNRNKKGKKVNLSDERRKELAEYGRKSFLAYNGSDKQKEDINRYFSNPENRKKAGDNLRIYAASQENRERITKLTNSPEWKAQASKRMKGNSHNKKYWENPENHKKASIHGALGSHKYNHLDKNKRNLNCKLCNDEFEKDILPIDDPNIRSEKIVSFFNHKVISIKPGPTQDVYDLTVDNYHNFATSAGVFVHNCEMLVDPFVAQPFTVNGEKNTYIVEICDPVEGQSYDIGDQFGIKTGLLVSDFCYPRWFGLPQVKLRNGATSLLQSYRGSVIKSFELAREGYISVKPIGGNESEWSQIFGRDISEVPHWSSRLSRLTGEK